MLYLPTTSNDATKLFALEYWLAQQDYPSTVFLLWSTRRRLCWENIKMH